MGYESLALTRREGETPEQCVERHLTSAIANRPDLKRAFPARRAVPYSITHQALTVWLAIEENAGMTSECIFAEYWRFGTLGVMVEYSFIPEARVPAEVPPFELLDYLDNEGMPRTWPVALANRIRVWRDSMARLSKVSFTRKLVICGFWGRLAKPQLRHAGIGACRRNNFSSALSSQRHYLSAPSPVGIEIRFVIEKGSNLKICKTVTGYEDVPWKKFKKQVRRWIRERGEPDAEKRFILNYIPEAKVLDPAKIGALTDGLLFSLNGTVYWDRGYETKSFLEELMTNGIFWMVNAGEEK
jgi:hypothetical protein